MISFQDGDSAVTAAMIWPVLLKATVNVFSALVLFAILLYPTSVATCPRRCECIIRTNLMTVDCRAAGYTRVPRDLPTDTIILNMEGNSLDILRGDSFRDVPNLQQLSLANCRLSEIEYGAFSSLNNLEVLILDRNRLDEVPANIFSSVPNLKTLGLNDNPVRSIEGAPFRSLSKLSKLELGQCRLQHLSHSIFLGLENLNFLSLHQNELVTLDLKTFKPLLSLLQLDLHRNPLSCNCTLRPLVDWMKRRRVGFSVPPTCAEPLRARDKNWDQMSLLDFACAPKVRLKPLQTTDSVIQLQCQVFADPSASVLWYRDDIVITDLFMNYTISGDVYDSVDKVSVLTLYGTSEEVFGRYFCYAENPGGSMNETFSHRHEETHDEVLIEGSKSAPAVVIILVSFAVVISVVLCLACCLKRRRRVTVKRGRRRNGNKMTSNNENCVELDALRKPEQNSIKTNHSALVSDPPSWKRDTPEFTPDNITYDKMTVHNTTTGRCRAFSDTKAYPHNSFEEQEAGRGRTAPSVHAPDNLHGILDDRSKNPILRRTVSVPGDGAPLKKCTFASGVSPTSPTSVRHNHVSSACRDCRTDSPRGHRPRQNSFDPSRIYDMRVYEKSTSPPVGTTRVKYCLETDL